MKYKKKPIIIEAIKNDGVWKTILSFLESFSEDPFIFPIGTEPPITREDDGSLRIKTKEGTMKADVGDWVIRGIKGELYPCKPDIFEATYDLVD